MHGKGGTRTATRWVATGVATIVLGALAPAAASAAVPGLPTPTPTPTASATPSPTPTPSPTAPPGHTEVQDAPLSAALLAAQVAEANRISGVLEESTGRVAVEMRRMDALATRANAILESLQAARETEIAAHQEAASAHEELARLEARLAAARTVLRAWVFDVYSGGGNDADISGMLTAMTSTPEEVGDPLGDLSYLTEQRTRALQDVRILTAEQVRLSAAADDAESTATAARARIETDKAALDAVMVEQRARIGTLRNLQIAEVEKAGPVASILVGARTPAAKAAAARLRAALTASVVETASVGKPCTDDSGQYPNGLFPASALCPVWGAPGEMLAPAAAASFNALSQAYAAQTGSPLCVTDSYRSLAEQVSVKSTRGAFAATPGTSHHGLGRATDLCGGIQDYGNAAHRWMQQNAPLYGWFQPAWAQSGGSLPEPWHWEYAG